MILLYFDTYEHSILELDFHTYWLVKLTLLDFEAWP